MTIREITFKYALVMTLLLSAAFLFGKTSMVYASEIIEITEEDQQECQLLVDEFCGAWMNEQYEVMYQALSKSGIGKMDKEKFIRTYKKDGKLVDYSIEDAVPKGDNVLVKTNLKFQNDIPPRIISGLHTFDMERDKGNWRIKYIMPPIKTPAVVTLPGGSHPGE